MDTTSFEVKSVARPACAIESSTWLHFAFVMFAVATGVAAWLIASLYRTHFPADAVDTSSILLPPYRSAIDPKPVERFTFLMLAATLPITAFAVALARRDDSFRWARSSYSRMVAFVVAAAFFVPFVRFAFDTFLMTGVSPQGTHPFLLLCGMSLVAALALSFSTTTPRRIAARRISCIAWTIFLTCIALQLVAWRIVNSNSVTEGGTWWMSMDAVMYSVSQVVAGRTLLADLPSQYGLFPEFIAPILHFSGLSVFSFSALFAVMQMGSLCAVFWVVHRMVRHPLFKIGFGIALVMVTYETCLFLIGIPEQYFQYWPVRFFWPALSVFAFYRYARKPSLLRSILMSAVGAIACVWNVDSGIMIELAFAASLVAKWVALFACDKDRSILERRATVLKLCLHVVAFVVVLAAAALYLSGKADRPMHWAWLIEYQRLFYGLGFMMLPLPTYPSPWMSIVAVYLLGILTAASIWRRSPRSRAADVLLFTSLLGIGLFVYYEGRAHMLNLVTVSWPALFAATLMADRVTRAASVRILPKVSLAPAAVAGGVILLCSVAFLRGIPKLADSALSTINEWSTPASFVVHNELAFLSSNTRRGEACVILSKRQGLYYASVRLVSPLVGPGYIETLTVRDLDSMLAQLRQHRFDCVFLGERGSAPDLGVDLLNALPTYRVVKTNSLGTMAELQPR